MTLEEVEKKIQDFESSEEYNRLMKPTFLEIAGKPRSETAFTSLFAWVLSNKWFRTLKDTPIKLFLRLLCDKAKDQEQNLEFKLMDEKIKKAIESDIVRVDVIDWKTEFKLPGKTKKKNGFVDLVIIVNFEFRMIKVPLYIILENKIDHDEENQQCNRYYNYFSKKKEILINNTPYVSSKDVQDLYVFSSIKEPEDISCDQYILITHKDIYYNILLPIFNVIIHLSGHTSEKYYLKEYMSALISIKTEGKSRIVDDEGIRKDLKGFYKLHQDFLDNVLIVGCGDSNLKNKLIHNKGYNFNMDNETKEKLKIFYEENQDLILALLSEGCECEEIIEACHNIRKSNSILYEIYYDKEYLLETNQRRLLSELVKHFMERNNKTRENIQKLFSGMIGAIFVDDNNTGFVEIEIKGEMFKISTERARNKIDKIIDVFSEKGYEIRAIN